MARMSFEQELIVAVATMAAGFLSMFGSGSIICNIIRNKKYKRDSYHRLLLGACITDFVSSVGWFMAPWAPPQESSLRVLPIGNVASCSIQAYFIQVGIGFMVYNACLSIYYVLTIRYNVTEKIMSRREIYMHAISLLWGFGIAIIPIPLEIYNELGVGTGCWLGRSPQYCDAIDSIVLCVRGASVDPSIVGYIIGGFPSITSLIIVIVCNRLVYISVKKNSETTRRFSIGNDRLQKRTEAIASQATWYVIVFLNSMFWQILLRFLDGLDVITDDNESAFTPLIVLAAFFSGFSGFGLLLVYIRPRYIRYRARKLSRFSSVMAALSFRKPKGLPPRSRASSNYASSDGIPNEIPNELQAGGNLK
jgi:hypothetical protein